MADYQVVVSYNGKKLIPGPFVELAREVERNPDGTARMGGWKITVRGKVSAVRGSPDHTGAFWTGTGYPPDTPGNQATPELRLRNLKNKLGALAELFSEDGHWFEIQPADGSAPIKFQPRIDAVTFPEGKWFDVADFAVQMQADVVYFGGVADGFDAAGLPAEETWQIEPADDFRPTYRVTHTVSAQNRARFAADGTGGVEAAGWELAKARVDAAAGAYADVFGVGFGAYNHTRTRTLDTAGGRYAVTDSWLLCQQNYTEDVTVEHATSVEAGVDTVRVSGTITGLQDGDDQSTRFANAEARLNAAGTNAAMLARAQADTGVTLNPTPVATAVGRNRVAGTCTYSGEFNTRPAVTAGRLTESFNISVDYAVPVVAQIGVINRPAGPVLQPTGSSTQKSATAQYDIGVRVAYGQPAPAAPVVNPLADVLSFIGAQAVIYVASDRENWNPRTGKYSRTTSFIYQ